MNNFLNYIFAPQCIFCSKVFNDFCLNCLRKVLPLEKSICVECKNHSPQGLTHRTCLKNTSPTVLYSLFDYFGYAGECVRRSKYFRKEFASLKKLTAFGVLLHKKDLFLLDDFYVVSVPLSKKRFKERGFNQSDFIATIVSKQLNLNVLKGHIVRTKNTEAQFTKTKFERRKNLHKAFKVLKGVEGKEILIVDDIFTTGSTMLELSKTLYNAGAKEVRCFALTRVLST